MMKHYLPIILILGSFSGAFLYLACNHSAPAQSAPSNLQKQWKTLANSEPARAFAAYKYFISHPQESVPFLGNKLKPVTPPDPQRLQKLISDLNDPSYAVRVKAYSKLRKIGSGAEAALRNVLKETKSQEVQTRAARLLKRITWRTIPAELRTWRAIEILEYIRTDDAKQVLKKLAAGPQGFWQTEEAQQSLVRMKEKSPPSPTGKAALRGVLRGHTSSVYSVAFGPEGKLLASGSADDTLRLWDIKTAKQKALLGRQNNVYALLFTPDGKRLVAAGTGNAVWLWDLAARKQVASFVGHTSTIRGLALHPNGKLLASASYDKTVRLWDLATRQCVATLRGHKQTVYKVAFSPDGKTLASASADDSIMLWDVPLRAHKATLTGHKGNVYSLEFSGDGKSLISCDTGRELHVWEVLTGRLKKKWLRNNNHLYLAMHPDGETIASSGSGRTVVLKNIVTDQQLALLNGHTSTIRALDFSPNGRFLATGSNDRTIRIWTTGAKQ